MGEGGLGVEAEYVEVQPLKVDSTDESSLILPWEMRDGGGGVLGQVMHYIHTGALHSSAC